MAVELRLTTAKPASFYLRAARCTGFQALLCLAGVIWCRGGGTEVMNRADVLLAEFAESLVETNCVPV